MRTICSAALFVVALVAPRMAQAQVDFTTLPIRPGDIVYVKEASGVEVSGPLLRVSTSSFVVGDHEFTPADVRQIDRRGDSRRNGAIVGGAILGGWCAFICGQGVVRGQLAIAIGVNTGFGALIGFFVDASRVGRTTVFRTPPTVRLIPVIAPERAAIAMSLSF